MGKVSVKRRKVHIGKGNFYIRVNNKDYVLRVGNNTEGLEVHRSLEGDYVVIEGTKYYIYLDSDLEAIKKDKKKTVLLFDGVKFRKVSTDGSLDDLHRLLKCDKIESPFLATNIDKAGIYWTIDEEGSFTSPITLLLMDFSGKIVSQVYGPILFSRIDDKGDIKGLSDKDIEFIKREFVITLYRESPNSFPLYRVITGIR